MTHPDALPAEIKAPMRLYRHLGTGSNVTFIGTIHTAGHAYFAQITDIISTLHQHGAHVYYEHVRAPSREESAAASKQERANLALIARRFAERVYTARDMGLAVQNQALPWRENGWQVHDISRLDIARSEPLTAKQARYAVRHVKLDHIAYKTQPPAERHAGVLAQIAGQLSLATGAVGAAVLLPKPMRERAEARDRLVLEALDKQRTDTPGAHFVIVYGAGHLIGVGHGLTERGYTLHSETWLTAIDITTMPTLAARL